jgi:hypothetical protein
LLAEIYRQTESTVIRFRSKRIGTEDAQSEANCDHICVICVITRDSVRIHAFLFVNHHRILEDIMKGKKDFCAGISLVLVLLGGIISSRAQGGPEPLSSLTAQWWQYATSIPASVNPLLDPTGADCMVGQRDPIWFLAGKFLAGGKIRRTCAIPAGVWLFFPVINSYWTNSPNVCGQTGDNLSVAQMRSLVAPFIDAGTHMSVKVDGKEVKNLVRVKSEAFATTFPENNIFNDPCGGPGTVPAGVYTPSVDDGYYVLLEPLSKGDHWLRFHSESGDFKLDVTYMLHVGVRSAK